MGAESRCIRVLHGPNLNLLGSREPAVYGRTTLDAIDRHLRERARGLGFELVASQHNGEGELVEAVQAADTEGAAGLLLNPAAYTHTSIALRDALLAVSVPAVEVHLSNPEGREAFRQRNLIADVVIGRVAGFGARSYELALEGLASYIGRAGDAGGGGATA